MESLNLASRDYARETAGVDEVKAFKAGAEWALEQFNSEAGETAIMKWLHENYLETYDKYTSSYHRMISRSLITKINQVIRK